MSQFKSTQPQSQQTPKTGQQFKYLEPEKVRSQDQQKLLVRNQNRVAEMASHQLKAQQQVRNQQQDVKQEGVRLHTQEQLTTGLKSQVKEQQRLLNQQQEQVEERLKLMTQQHQLLQERQRLWTELEPPGS